MAEKNPFKDVVQKLQEHEGDIAKKFDIIKGLIEGLPEDVHGEDWKETLEKAKNEFNDLRRQILDKKIEDLEEEMEDLEGFIKDPRKMNPIPPPPPWIWPFPWPPPPGFSGSGPGSPAPGLIQAGIVKQGEKSRLRIGLTSQNFITTRDKNTVWVWNPAKLEWDAKLETQTEITEMEQVDGTIAVRTKDALWLFHPLEYRWLGPLMARSEEIKSFNLSIPVTETIRDE